MSLASGSTAPVLGWTWTRAILQVLLASALPALIVGSAFAAIVTPPWRAMLHMFGAALLAGGLFLAVPGSDSRGRERGAVGFTVAVFLWLAYPGFAVLAGISPLTWSDQLAGLIWCLLIVVVVRSVRQADSSMAGRLSNVVLTVSCVFFAILIAANWSVLVEGGERTTRETNELIVYTQAKKPDVLHIILDGMGRQDVLKTRYGLDVTGELEALSRLGFTLAERGAANYSQTYLALASVLNADYLHNLGVHEGPDSTNRWPLVDLIQGASVVQNLKALGYEFVFIGSDYSASTSHALADRCYCDRSVFGEVESFGLFVSPIRSYPIFGPAYNAHRRKAVQAIADISGVPISGAPQLIVAHLIAPHPPFLLAPDGPRPNPSWPFGFHDDSKFLGPREAYREGYREQALFALREVTKAVKQFLENRRGRDVVVFIHGDHGPGLHYDNDRPLEGDTQERMSVLLAIRWPLGIGAPPVRSPVNLYRALYSAVFNVNVDTLDDLSFVSPFTRPYDLRQVPDARQANKDAE